MLDHTGDTSDFEELSFEIYRWVVRLDDVRRTLFISTEG